MCVDGCTSGCCATLLGLLVSEIPPTLVVLAGKLTSAYGTWTSFCGSHAIVELESPPAEMQGPTQHI